MEHMQRAALDGVDLEYETLGAGEPVVFVHHGAGIDWFDPLVAEPAFAGGYCLIRYHRAGYGGSSRLTGPIMFTQEAARLRVGA